MRNVQQTECDHLDESGVERKRSRGNVIQRSGASRFDQRERSGSLSAGQPTLERSVLKGGRSLIRGRPASAIVEMHFGADGCLIQPRKRPRAVYFDANAPASSASAPVSASENLGGAVHRLGAPPSRVTTHPLESTPSIASSSAQSRTSASPKEAAAADAAAADAADDESPLGVRPPAALSPSARAAFPPLLLAGKVPSKRLRLRRARRAVHARAHVHPAPVEPRAAAPTLGSGGGRDHLRREGPGVGVRPSQRRERSLGADHRLQKARRKSSARRVHGEHAPPPGAAGFMGVATTTLPLFRLRGDGNRRRLLRGDDSRAFVLFAVVVVFSRGGATAGLLRPGLLRAVFFVVSVFFSLEPRDSNHPVALGESIAPDARPDPLAPDRGAGPPLPRLGRVAPSILGADPRLGAVAAEIDARRRRRSRRPLVRDRAAAEAAAEGGGEGGGGGVEGDRALEIELESRRRLRVAARR